MTYGTLCHAIDYQILSTKLLPREAEDFARGGNYPSHVSVHIVSLLAASLNNNSGLIFICLKIMNLFTCGEDISKLAV